MYIFSSCELLCMDYQGKYHSGMRGEKTAKTSLFVQTNSLPVTMNILGNSDKTFPNKTASSSGFILLVNFWAFYMFKRWGGGKSVPTRFAPKLW